MFQILKSEGSTAGIQMKTCAYKSCFFYNSKLPPQHQQTREAEHYYKKEPNTEGEHGSHTSLEHKLHLPLTLFPSWGFKTQCLSLIVNQEIQQYLLCISLVQNCNKYWLFHYFTGDFTTNPQIYVFLLYSMKDTEPFHNKARNVGHSDEDGSS